MKCSWDMSIYRGGILTMVDNLYIQEWEMAAELLEIDEDAALALGHTLAQQCMSIPITEHFEEVISAIAPYIKKLSAILKSREKQREIVWHRSITVRELMATLYTMDPDTEVVGSTGHPLSYVTFYGDARWEDSNRVNVSGVALTEDTSDPR